MYNRVKEKSESSKVQLRTRLFLLEILFFHMSVFLVLHRDDVIIYCMPLVNAAGNGSLFAKEVSSEGHG